MNIVITGAARGIGLELATQALKGGNHILAVVRNPSASPELQELKARSGEALEICRADVIDPSASAQVAKAIQHWPCVDILINNAGVFERGEGYEDFILSFKTNSIAPFLITRALFPKLRASKNPKAIQITSLMGSIADNESGSSYAYRSSKAALNMINKSLSIDEPWLTTVVIHPGWVQTRMGGEEAPTPVVEAATGIWRVIHGLKPSDSGSFLDYEGDRLPW